MFRKRPRIMTAQEWDAHYDMVERRWRRIERVCYIVLASIVGIILLPYAKVLVSRLGPGG